MKRSDFLKKLGIGIGVAIVAPSMLINKEQKELNKRYIMGVDPYGYRIVSSHMGVIYYDRWGNSKIQQIF